MYNNVFNPTIVCYNGAATSWWSYKRDLTSWSDAKSSVAPWMLESLQNTSIPLSSSKTLLVDSVSLPS